MVRRGSGRDDEAMTSTEHIDRPPVADRDGPLLIGYEGSEHAKDAIRSAASLLPVKDALVVTVWQPPTDIGAFAWYGADGRSPRRGGNRDGFSWAFWSALDAAGQRLETPWSTTPTVRQWSSTAPATTTRAQPAIEAKPPTIAP